MPFGLRTIDRYTLIELKGKCSIEDASALEVALKNLIEKNKIQYFIFLCDHCEIMTIEFIKKLSQFQANLKKIGGAVCLVSPNRFVRQTIAQIGLDQTIPHNLSLQGALTSLGLKMVNRIDVKFVNPFLLNAVRVFEMQAQLKSNAGNPRVKSANEPRFLGAVTGIIPVDEEAFQGILAISLSLELFKHLARIMLSETHNAVTNENYEMAAELSNMILGGAKKELASLGYNLKQTLPLALFGKSREAYELNWQSAIVIPFESSKGAFWIEIFAKNETTEVGKNSATPVIKKAG